MKFAYQKRLESADKPGSVVGNHSSRPAIAHWLKQPTRFQCGPHHKEPYLVLLRVEFTSPYTVTSNAVRSYRTLSPLPAPKRLGGLLSAALVVGFRRPDVIWHPALWSPDFPPLACASSDCLADSEAHSTHLFHQTQFTSCTSQ